MRKLTKPIDFVTKDYEGFRKLMLDLIPLYTPEWTDNSESDMGVVILELLAHGLDILSYYQDKAVNENFIATAKTRKAIINLCRLLGYELTSQIPSVYSITFTKNPAFLNQTIRIPFRTKVSTDPRQGAPVIFETDSELVIPAGQSSGNVEATHGVSMPEDILGVADGTEFQKYRLTHPDVILDSLEVRTVESGVTRYWTRVTDFLSSLATDRHYKYTVDELNRFTIEFGNGASGMKAPDGAVISAVYRVGGGAIGNVGIGKINTFVDREVAGIMSISNQSEAILKGVDPEDIEHARVIAPKVYRTSSRAVTPGDFEAIASSFPGIVKAKCEETFNANGDLNIYIVPADYGTATTALKNELLAYLKKVKLIQDNPIVKDTTYTTFNIAVNVTAERNFINADIKGKVEARLKEAFETQYMEFGEDILPSYITKEVMSVDGVADVSVTTPSAKVNVSDTSIAKLGTVTATVTGGVDA